MKFEKSISTVSDTSCGSFSEIRSSSSLTDSETSTIFAFDFFWTKNITPFSPFIDVADVFFLKLIFTSAISLSFTTVFPETLTGRFSTS